MIEDFDAWSSIFPGCRQEFFVDPNQHPILQHKALNPKQRPSWGVNVKIKNNRNPKPVSYINFRS